MSDKINTTKEDVKSSISTLYSALLDKRRAERELKEEMKLQEKEAKRLAKEEKQEEEKEKLSKKEKREAALDSWKSIIVGLTGDDLEYSSDKGAKKKKYKKWIGDEDENVALIQKPKKVKKHNYRKEFEGELNMLKTLVADQNRFTNDLQKRFTAAAGPANKDAMPLNKTLVELASTINASRSNSLGVLREISNIKKTMADLYMKQKKLDADLGNVSVDATAADMGLLGSNIASMLYNETNNSPSSPTPGVSVASPVNVSRPIVTTNTNRMVQPIVEINNDPNMQVTPGVQIEEFDPETWEPTGVKVSDSIMFENIPHSIVVEKNGTTGDVRFKAVRNDDGTELTGCPVPTSDITKLKIDEKGMTVRGEFDEVYKLEVV